MPTWWAIDAPALVKETRSPGAIAARSTAVPPRVCASASCGSLIAPPEAWYTANSTSPEQSKPPAVGPVSSPPPHTLGLRGRDHLGPERAGGHHPRRLGVVRRPGGDPGDVGRRLAVVRDAAGRGHRARAGVVAGEHQRRQLGAAVPAGLLARLQPRRDRAVVPA